MEHHLLSNHPTKMDDGFKHSTEPATFSRINHSMVDIYMLISGKKYDNQVEILDEIYIYIFPRKYDEIVGCPTFFPPKSVGLPMTPASDSAVGAKGT